MGYSNNVMLLLIVVLCFIICIIADPVPGTPLQFTAKAKISEGTWNPKTYTGTYYYDYIAQKVRIDEMSYGDTAGDIKDYQTMLEYKWDAFEKKCTCTSLNDRMFPAHVPLGANFVGWEYIRTQCTEWEAQDPVLIKITNNNKATYYVDEKGFVERINTSAQMFDFYTMVPGAPAASVFTPPSYCDPNSCPYTPSSPPPPLGTCSDTPDACECIDVTEETFCDDITYPINSNLGYELGLDAVDDTAERVYAETVDNLENPSQTCLDNLKAYICALYFPVCSGDTYDPSYAPCNTICPSCSCGASVAINCNATTAGYCTQYGSNNYC